MEGRVKAMAHRLGLEAVGFDDVTALPRDAVLTGAGQPFRVFTPYARAWMAKPIPEPGPSLRALVPNPILAALPSLPPPTLADWGMTPSARIPQPGEEAGRKRMEAFFSKQVHRYAAERDCPDVDGTSRLSADLRWGTLSIRELIWRTRRAIVRAETAVQRSGPAKFLSELIWREFYMAVLFAWPEVLEHEFQKRFAGLPWLWPGKPVPPVLAGTGVDPKESFERWSEGATGFPIVDAGMRQLAATGWMHNRVRMIVAMFLTKDLHLDWRLGEQFFMQHLVDGEIASNNGGWQWSAGTGADAAPYFRIQNPWKQTERCDPVGEYIKKWVPELRDVAAATLTKPPKPDLRLAPGYPAPMVDHARERLLTLRMFIEAR